MCFEAIGVLAAVLIQGQLVQGTRCNGDEEKDDQQTKTVQDMKDQVCVCVCVCVSSLLS